MKQQLHNGLIITLIRNWKITTSFASVKFVLLCKPITSLAREKPYSRKRFADDDFGSAAISRNNMCLDSVERHASKCRRTNVSARAQSIAFVTARGRRTFSRTRKGVSRGNYFPFSSHRQAVGCLSDTANCACGIRRLRWPFGAKRPFWGKN